MDRSRDGARLRAWGGGTVTSFAFPLAAVVAAVLVFATADLSTGLVLGLLVALVPWALLAGGVRLGPWAMVASGVGVPAAVVLGYHATGASFLAMLAVAWLAAHGGGWAAEMTALAASVTLPIVDVATNPAGYQGEAWVYLATGTLFSWFIGRVLRRERQLVVALTDAQGRLQDAAAASERHRIARDVHDVVGHSLTVVLLNLMGARRVLTRDPAVAGEALDRAERVGRDSLDSVRAVVGLLRSPADDGAAEWPVPGAADIASLARAAADAGVPVRVEAQGDLEAVDSSVGLAAFRLVQEAITNVEHHAPMAEVNIAVVNDGDRLAVRVRNGPPRQHREPSAGGGTGLAGLRERLTALGGTMTAGPDGDGWLVEASIPLLDAPPRTER